MAPTPTQPADSPAAPARPFRYGWVVLAGAAGLLLLGLGGPLGSYAAAFIAAGWLAVAAGVAALVIKRPKLAADRRAVGA